MTSSRHVISKVSPLAIVLGFASTLNAQVDVNPPRPNVMLLVDSSGSMEYTTVAQTKPTCVPEGADNTRSRWLTLVETLNGPIANYSCKEVDRRQSTFYDQYKIAADGACSAAAPPDYHYPIAYHLPISGTCAPSPGPNTDTITYCAHGAARPCATSTCSFPDSAGGLLDAFKEQIRFGLMTFDTLPSESECSEGTWTYQGGTVPVEGAPKGCSEAEAYDVGARSAAAPLWEGRMIAFGPPQSDNETELLRTTNEKIQEVLLSTRPFGATPIAGMLKDALDFFRNDIDPDDSGNIAPKNDPYVTGGCRSNYIILLTDGEPNMELRTACGTGSATAPCTTPEAGCCPFDKPEDIAAALAEGTTTAPQIPVYVVGFAASPDGIEDVSAECSTLTTLDLTDTINGKCANPTAGTTLAVCCTLNRIAYNGGTTKAYFADTAEQLKTALAEILSNAAQGTTSRTFPVFASAVGSNSSAASFRFFTSFKSRITGTGLWPGVIERQRYVCKSTSDEATLEDVDYTKGDDFVKNVNNTDSSSRRFFSVLRQASVDGSIHSTYSIRTDAENAKSDGASDYTGTAVSGDGEHVADLIVGPALELANSSCMQDESLSEATCHDRYMNWLVGEANGSSEGYHRCSAAGTASCSLIADVYHSVPSLVNRPSDNLRDESYQKFAFTDQRKRPLVLYTSTNDGLLHAFKVASNDPAETTAADKVEALTNNELWAFIPPAVLPRIADEYPNVHQRLLDGAPVTRDVAASVTSTGDIVYERNLKNAAASTLTWRTVLVQSFGGAYPGYFALDITNPEPDDSDPTKGPQFLWQLTTDDAGNGLFGDTGATPTITTLYFDPDGGSNPREISVALLPGGDGGKAPDTTRSCARADTTLAASGIAARSKVPCYDDADGKDRGAARRARSLTVVRLDNGKIVRTFRNAAADAPASIAATLGSKTSNWPKLDAPIVGQPVAYPGWTGAIADRAYVGDRDGTLWRVDLASTKPADWTMKLFFDAYSSEPDAAGESEAHTGQPIATPPIISTDELGNVTVAFSTGNQEDLVGTTGTKTYIYSLLERASSAIATSVEAEVNWYYLFLNGERVTGPMTLFSNGLYFSTYAPPTSTSACSSGASRVGGMHYLEADELSAESEDGEELSRGGKAWLPKADSLVQFYSQTDSLFAEGSVIFGVGIAQVPSCFESGVSTTDPFFSSTYQPVSTTSSSRYQLVVQTGSQGEAASASASTKATAIDLPSPDNSPRINSWAMVME